MSAKTAGPIFIPAGRVNREQWDACLAQSPAAIIYACSWYLDEVCERWAAVVEVQNGRYVSLFPLPEKSRWGLRQVYQPFFTQQLGLFTTAASRCADLAAYLEAVPQTYFRVSLQLHTLSQAPAGGTGLLGWKLKTRSTYHLSLQGTYPELWRGYRQQHKRYLKKQPAGQVRGTTDIGPLIRLFRETKGPVVPELQDADYDRLARLAREALDRQQGQVLELHAAGQLLAAAFFLLGFGKVIYLFGASAAAGRENGAMVKLMDAVISQQAGTGRILDFEGSDQPALAKFYAGFGAQPVPYLSLVRKRFFFK